MTQIDILLIVIEILSVGWFLLSMINILFSCFLDDRGASIYSIVTAVITFGIYVLTMGVESNIKSSPTAMDVYQGKTTLGITYKDGVPVDSIVVFKD